MCVRVGGGRPSSPGDSAQSYWLWADGDADGGRKGRGALGDGDRPDGGGSYGNFSSPPHAPGLTEETAARTEGKK